MRIRISDLALFKEICRKICINIPPNYRWQWDEQRNMALVVLENEDAELVFFPLIKEFKHNWGFSTAPPENESVCARVSGQFGLMPGQVLFTSHPLCNILLCVAWWPWGEDRKISMRIGLIRPAKSICATTWRFNACLAGWVSRRCPDNDAILAGFVPCARKPSLARMP